MNGGFRDELLGQALRDLDVPEHGPAFYMELAERLADERRASALARRGRSRERRLRVRWGGRVLVGIAAAVAAAVVGLPHIGDRTRPEIGVEVASAAEVKAKVRRALAELRTLRGTLVVTTAVSGEGNLTTRTQFVLTDRGDFHSNSGNEQRSYDAGRLIERYHAKANSIASELTGVAPGPPDGAGSVGELTVQRRLGSVVRALLAAGDARVKETRFEGRLAWRLRIPVAPNAIDGAYSADRLDLTIDQRTGMPVRVVATHGGRFLGELRVERLAVNSPVSARELRVAFPAGTEIYREDLGFRRVSLAQARTEVGYDPLVPRSLPKGFELADVTVANQARATGSEGANPPSVDVVSLSYRRGLDQFVVTTRRVGADPSAWSDPLATGEGFVDRPRRFAVRAGALRGTSAELLVVPQGIPHVWALDDALVVTVAGDLSEAELISVLESLAKAG